MHADRCALPQHHEQVRELLGILLAADFTGGLLAPIGTPPAVIARYEAAALDVARSPAFRDYLATQGYEAFAADSAQFAKLVREGAAKWERVVKERGIKVE